MSAQAPGKASGKYTDMTSVMSTYNVRFPGTDHKLQHVVTYAQMYSEYPLII